MITLSRRSVALEVALISIAVGILALGVLPSQAAVGERYTAIGEVRLDPRTGVVTTGSGIQIAPQTGRGYDAKSTTTAFCFNHERVISGTTPGFVEVAGNAATFMSLADHERLSGDEFVHAVTKVILNGYGHADLIQNAYGLTDDQWELATQQAVWYYTDGFDPLGLDRDGGSTALLKADTNVLAATYSLLGVEPTADALRGDARIKVAEVKKAYVNAKLDPSSLVVPKQGTTLRIFRAPRIDVQNLVSVEVAPLSTAPALGTVAVDAADSDHVLAGQGSIIDTVNYTNLKPNTSYTVSGELISKADGKPTGIKGSTTFTAEKATGSITVKFDVPAGLDNTTLVAYESLTLKGDTEVIAEHKDLADVQQTVRITKGNGDSTSGNTSPSDTPTRSTSAQPSTSPSPSGAQPGHHRGTPIVSPTPTAASEPIVPDQPAASEPNQSDVDLAVTGAAIGSSMLVAAAALTAVGGWAMRRRK